MDLFCLCEECEEVQEKKKKIDLFKDPTSSFDLYKTRLKNILSWRPFEFATINF